MLHTPVALVPYSSDLVDTRELLHVAAALQTQVARDLNPLWGVSGSVSAFRSLDDVPPSSTAVVIVKNIPAAEHGFHLGSTGQPLALIQYGDDWWVRASHELVELLCDPWGKRTVAGPSLHDRQGEVDYLLEVSDPCQHVTYEINGVEVSDFVTPDYYDLAEVPGGRYSFTGAVTMPRQLLEGGYISWYTRPPENRVFQAFAPPATSGTPKPVKPSALEIKALTVEPVAPTFSRALVDSRPTASRPGVSDRPGARRGGSSPYCTPGDETTAYGESVRREVDLILETLAGAAPPEPKLDDIIDLIEKLATDDAFRRQFQRIRRRSSPNTTSRSTPS